MNIQATKAEREQKFNPAQQRWKAKPNVGPCCKGDFREWHIQPETGPLDDTGRATDRHAPRGDTGTSYQNQLYCRYWKTFVNPSGFACDLCKAQNWPDAERWRVHVIPDAIKARGRAAAEDALVAAVARGQLEVADAERIADEHFPDE